MYEELKIPHYGCLSAHTGPDACYIFVQTNKINGVKTSIKTLNVLLKTYFLFKCIYDSNAQFPVRNVFTHFDTILTEEYDKEFHHMGQQLSTKAQYQQSTGVKCKEKLSFINL